MTNENIIKVLINKGTIKYKKLYQKHSYLLDQSMDLYLDIH